MRTERKRVASVPWVVLVYVIGANGRRFEIAALVGFGVPPGPSP
jgi:hypothetical protein